MRDRRDENGGDGRWDRCAMRETGVRNGALMIAPEKSTPSVLGRLLRISKCIYGTRHILKRGRRLGDRLGLRLRSGLGRSARGSEMVVKGGCGFDSGLEGVKMRG